MDMLKRLKRSRGFTLIEIAIVVAIIGILILIALPLFSGARVRAYIAEARSNTSEWKALTWACLIEKSFDESKCDTFTEVSFTLPGTSAAWNWGLPATMGCGTGAVTPTTSLGTCANQTGASAYVAINVPTADTTINPSAYLLVLSTGSSNKGKVQEVTDGASTVTP